LHLNEASMKYINIRTGQEVPANEVRELTPGSGLYVHVTTRTKSVVVSRPRRESEQGIVLPGIGMFYPTGETEVNTIISSVVDSYVAAIEDGVSYNPEVHNPLTAIAVRNRSGV
jgi:hypothetical protein